MCNNKNNVIGLWTRRKNHDTVSMQCATSKLFARVCLVTNLIFKSRFIELCVLTIVVTAHIATSTIQNLFKSLFVNQCREQMRGKFAADCKLFLSVLVKSASPPLKPFTHSENKKKRSIKCVHFVELLS